MSQLLRFDGVFVEVTNYNDDFLILRSAETPHLRKVGKAIFLRQFDFVEEVIVTEVEICLKLNAQFGPFKIGYLTDVQLGATHESRTYQLPVYFDQHEDWELIESSSGFSKNQVIQKLVEVEYTIAMFGFLPGFMYLDGLPASLQVPRKTIPAKYVEANSIAIGGKYLGLYALDSPGGWNVIGKTPIALLQIPELPPVVPNLMDKIRLVPIDQNTYVQMVQQSVVLKIDHGQS